MAANDQPEIPLPPSAALGASCPWCSAPVASPDDVTCGACGATLQGDAAIEIPGVTAIDGQHASRAAAPRKIRRTFGALFVGSDDEIPPPSEAELPALEMPDAEVRHEMLRLQLDAELADLTARAAALAAERGIPMPTSPAAAPELGAAPEADDAPGAAPESGAASESEAAPEEDARP